MIYESTQVRLNYKDINYTTYKRAEDYIKKNFKIIKFKVSRCKEGELLKRNKTYRFLIICKKK